ncbi:MurR/RpiR family transcriptional regulator [Spiroplasma sp. SV19]|uniref:MurR/RpiR family transcriptional regulator n=1 Tax=Spiroplasma sp. SV19 TaxID=2570468 RepID=UPI0024B77736|nr:MurR/RpiR family transcriptional regulator [Spiroplasma sp. SV19]WHQ36580.1 SIS domain-containing protein [Spiroplasma sp. SV19]
MLLNKLRLHFNELTKTEQQIADYILNNFTAFSNMTLKELASKFHVSLSTITRLFQKIGINGFKAAKNELFAIDSDFLVTTLQPVARLYKNTLCEGIIHSLNALDFNKINDVAMTMYETKKIVIFATGNSKILGQFFYFQLLYFQFDVTLISSLYDEKGFNLDQNTVVLILTIGGRNIKVQRYLTLIKNKPVMLKIIVSSSNVFVDKDSLDYHFHGKVIDETQLDTDIFPMNGKYIVQIILDQIIEQIGLQVKELDKEYWQKIKTKRITTKTNIKQNKNN